MLQPTGFACQVYEYMGHGMAIYQCGGQRSVGSLNVLPIFPPVMPSVYFIPHKEYHRHLMARLSHIQKLWLRIICHPVRYYAVQQLRCHGQSALLQNTQNFHCLYNYITSSACLGVL